MRGEEAAEKKRAIPLEENKASHQQKQRDNIPFPAPSMIK